MWTADQENVMKSQLAHIDFNVRPEHIAFYKDLFVFLGWTLRFAAEGIVSLADPTGIAFCFLSDTLKDTKNDYDGPGMNHLAIGVPVLADVDAVAGYLREQGIVLLFETPRHRPEFAEGADHTYYQAMFASPDGILFEIVYAGPTDAAPMTDDAAWVPIPG
jgi:catechol 2,3-dioxygenase-like lactoylglutathione lyase family enzyme